MTINVETKQNLVKISAVNFKHLTKKQQKEIRLRYPDINFDNKKELDGIIIEVESKAKRRANKIVKAMKQGEINKIQRDKEYLENQQYLEDIGYDKEEEEIEDKIDEYEYFIKKRDELIDRFIELNYNDISFEDWLDNKIRFNDVMKESRQAIIDYYNNIHKKDLNKITEDLTINVNKKKCIELTNNIAKVLESLDSVINDIDVNNDIKETETVITKDMIVKFVDIITDYPNHAIRNHLDSYKYNKEHLILLENSYNENCHSEEDHNNFCDAISEREFIMNLHKEELIHLITKQLTNN